MIDDKLTPNEYMNKDKREEPKEIEPIEYPDKLLSFLLGIGIGLFLVLMMYL